MKLLHSASTFSQLSSSVLGFVFQAELKELHCLEKLFFVPWADIPSLKQEGL